jgi:hypothetical protein
MRPAGPVKITSGILQPRSASVGLARVRFDGALDVHNERT